MCYEKHIPVPIDLLLFFNEMWLNIYVHQSCLLCFEIIYWKLYF